MNILDWKTLKVSYGDGSHIPEAIKSLCSPDQEERERAYWLLDNFIIVQGRLYEAAYYCIDELVNSLLKDDCISKEVVLDLVIELSLGKSLPGDFINENGILVELEIACWNKLKAYLNQFKIITTFDDRSKQALQDLIEILDSPIELQL